MISPSQGAALAACGQQTLVERPTGDADDQRGQHGNQKVDEEVDAGDHHQH
jgi:hypothetical protein